MQWTNCHEDHRCVPAASKERRPRTLRISGGRGLTRGGVRGGGDKSSCAYSVAVSWQSMVFLDGSQCAAAMLRVRFDLWLADFD